MESDQSWGGLVVWYRCSGRDIMSIISEGPTLLAKVLGRLIFFKPTKNSITFK
jgi:hypothetical protein